MNNEVTVLQLMHTSGLGIRTLSKILSYYNSNNINSSSLLSEYIPELPNKLNIKPNIISDIEFQRESAYELFDELDKHDIKMLIRGSSLYPGGLVDILGDYAPPVLFTRGNLGLLDKNAVGFCGSRNATQTALEFTEKCVSNLVKNNIVIVSGYAQGIDMTAHNTALINNGETIFVLATGILNFEWKSTIYQHINESNSLIISEFIPKFGWNAGNAMQRNNTICGLTNAMVLVESGLSGGTFEAGKSSLRFGVPLFVAEYSKSMPSSQGNEYFLNNGAYAISGASECEPNIKELLHTIDNPKLGPKQKSLFDKD